MPAPADAWQSGENVGVIHAAPRQSPGPGGNNDQDIGPGGDDNRIDAALAGFVDAMMQCTHDSGHEGLDLVAAEVGKGLVQLAHGPVKAGAVERFRGLQQRLDQDQC
mgnify:CR=1 FL=1